MYVACCNKVIIFWIIIGGMVGLLFLHRSYAEFQNRLYVSPLLGFTYIPYIQYKDNTIQNPSRFGTEFGLETDYNQVIKSWVVGYGGYFNWIFSNESSQKYRPSNISNPQINVTYHPYFQYGLHASIGKAVYNSLFSFVFGISGVLTRRKIEAIYTDDIQNVVYNLPMGEYGIMWTYALSKKIHIGGVMDMNITVPVYHAYHDLLIGWNAHLVVSYGIN